MLACTATVGWRSHPYGAVSTPQRLINVPPIVVATVCAYEQYTWFIGPQTRKKAGTAEA